MQPGTMRAGPSRALGARRTAGDGGHELVDHVAALRRYARALLGGATAEAEDLVQECLARVLARTRPWRPVKNMRAYLFTVLHNVHADRVGQWRRAVDVVPLEGAALHQAAPPAQYGRLELRDLSAALAQLPDEQRQVILLVGLEGMSYQEVAAVLKIPIGTVMSRLSRGREALRQLTAARTAPNLRRVK